MVVVRLLLTFLLHCTVRLKLALWVKVPLVALTVTMYVPLGVPGSSFGGGFEMLDPPPQLAQNSITSIARAVRIEVLRRCRIFEKDRIPISQMAIVAIKGVPSRRVF